MTVAREPKASPSPSAPPVGPEVDLRALDGFMLNVERLMASELVAISSGEEFKAAVLLWCRAWKQVPAASLPDDERVLAAFAGCSLQRWRKIRAVALRGFVRCADGRLYHRVLAEDALRAFARHQAYRARRAADQERLRDWRAKRVSPPARRARETPAVCAPNSATGLERINRGESALPPETGANVRSMPAPEALFVEPAPYVSAQPHGSRDPEMCFADAPRRASAVDRFKAGALAALDRSARSRPGERVNGSGPEPAAASLVARDSHDR